MAAQGDLSPCPAKSTLQIKMCLTKSTSKLHHQQQRSQKAKASVAQEDLYTINHGLIAPKIPKASVKISDVVVNMVIETCATTDILDEATYHNIHQKEDTELQPTTRYQCMSSCIVSIQIFSMALEGSK